MTTSALGRDPGEGDQHCVSAAHKMSPCSLLLGMNSVGLGGISFLIITRPITAGSGFPSNGGLPVIVSYKHNQYITQAHCRFSFLPESSSIWCSRYKQVISIEFRDIPFRVNRYLPSYYTFPLQVVVQAPDTCYQWLRHHRDTRKYLLSNVSSDLISCWSS